MSDWYLDPEFFGEEEDKNQQSVKPREDAFVVPSLTDQYESGLGKKLDPQRNLVDGADESGTWTDFWTDMGEHLVSSGTMGLSELSGVHKTTPWQDKNAKEMWGAAIGEAVGFLAPIKVIGTGIRGANH